MLKHRFKLLILPLLLLPALAVANGTEVFLVRNVNVIPMDTEQVLEGQDVLIKNGKIASIDEFDEARSPEKVDRVIDGEGQYLMPGLAEMHAHLPGAGDDTYREDVLFLYLANGVTLIRGMLGQPVHLEMREQIEQGKLMGPRLFTSGPGFSGGSVDSPEHGAEMVREQAEAGYDFLKIFPGLTREAFDAIAEAADDAGIPFAGHVPAAVGLPRAFEAGYATVDHFELYMELMTDPERSAESFDAGWFGYRLAPEITEEQIKDAARRTKEAGVWNVPTETLMHAVLADDPETIEDERPEFRYMPRRVVDGWKDSVRERQAYPSHDPEAAEAFFQVRLDLIRALHAEGAGLLLGSDAPQFFNVPGFSIHHELEVMSRSGLSNYEILETGTVNPARFYEEEDAFGTVAKGKRADLILLKANPLEDLGNLRQLAGVFYHGQWLSRDAIDQRLEAIALRNR